MTLQATVTDLYQRASAAGMFDAPYRPATPAAARRFAAIRAEAAALLRQFFPAAAAPTPPTTAAAPTSTPIFPSSSSTITSSPQAQPVCLRVKDSSPYYDLLHRLAHSRPA